MARTLRNRSRLTTTSGKWVQHSFFGDSTFTVTRNYTSTIADYRGRPVVPSPLNSIQYEAVDIWANGKVWKGQGTLRGYSFLAMPVNHNLGESEDTSAPGIPSGWELSSVARSNPSRPILFFPELVQDIVSLPRMIGNLKRLMEHPKSKFTPRGISNEYLGAAFGWLPIIEDLQKLNDLQKHVQKRAEQVEELYKGKGLRRRITWSKDTKVTRRYAQFNTDWGNIQLPCSVKVTKEVWATVRWKPTGPMPPRLLDKGGYEFYRNLVLGLTPEGMATGAWKIIPWTWLIGWFTNLGDILLIKSNTVPATYTEACLMRKVTMLVTPSQPVATGSPSENSVSQSGVRLWCQRQRTIGTGNLIPSVNMPFVDMFRLSIVGALAIQRLGR
jgi:hypothetical protein